MGNGMSETTEWFETRLLTVNSGKEVTWDLTTSQGRTEFKKKWHNFEYQRMSNATKRLGHVLEVSR